MESIDLEMEDLFDQEAGDDDDVGAQAALPELDNDEDGPMRTEEGENEQDDEEGVRANLQRLSKGAAKKRVTRPQPKLDVERLKSERGLAVLPKLFQDVKFKGKGHEAHDLKLVMGKLEHWAHRLYPMATFDQFIERMEKLGTKKPVQTCIKRVRLDMPLVDDDFVAQYDDHVVPPDGDSVVEEEEEQMNEVDADEAFEELMRQEREKQKTMMTKPFERRDDLHGEESVSMESSKDELTNDDSSKTSDTPVPLQMTPDVKERIEANKRRALEKRAARLGVSVESLLSPKTDDEICETKKVDRGDDHASEKDANETDNIEEDVSKLNQSQPSTLLISQSEEESNQTSQSLSSFQQNDDSRIISEKESISVSTAKTSTAADEEDMQTEEELLNILESDVDPDQPSTLCNDKRDETSSKKDEVTTRICSEGLTLDPENTSANDDLSEMDTSGVVKPDEGETLNLQLDMSTSETVCSDDGDTLNLQLDLSINESCEKLPCVNNGESSGNHQC